MSSFTLSNTAADIDSAVARVVSADSAPTTNSANMVTSGGVVTFIEERITERLNEFLVSGNLLQNRTTTTRSVDEGVVHTVGIFPEFVTFSIGSSGDIFTQFLVSNNNFASQDIYSVFEGEEHASDPFTYTHSVVVPAGYKYKVTWTNESNSQKNRYHRVMQLA